jgi:catechol 2,3-dioxygenase-like lactoylglutathione lyase family enzyme
MQISGIVPQLRTTDLASSLSFYTNKLGMSLEFQYEDFYAGVRAGSNVIHLKQTDEKDPSVDYVDQGDHFHLYLETEDIEAVAAELKSNGVTLVKDVHDTPWSTRELIIKDEQGHTLYFGQPVRDG